MFGQCTGDDEHDVAEEDTATASASSSAALATAHASAAHEPALDVVGDRSDLEGACDRLFIFAP